MQDSKILVAILDLQRIAGVIEGLSCATENPVADCLLNMTESLDKVIGLLEDLKNEDAE